MYRLAVLLPLALVFLLPGSARAQTVYTRLQPGNWLESAAWSPVGIPGSDDVADLNGLQVAVAGVDIAVAQLLNGILVGADFEPIRGLVQVGSARGISLFPTSPSTRLRGHFHDCFVFGPAGATLEDVTLTASRPQRYMLGAETDGWLRFGRLTLGSGIEIQCVQNPVSSTASVLAGGFLHLQPGATVRGNINVLRGALLNEGTIAFRPERIEAYSTIDGAIENRGLLDGAAWINGPVLQSGTLLVWNNGAGGFTGIHGDLTQTAGETRVPANCRLALYSGGRLLLQGGVLGGSGVIEPGGALRNASGTIQPGDGAGMLTIEGGYVQQSDAALEVEITGRASGQWDALEVRGDSALAGELRLAFGEGFLPVAGDVFPFLRAVSVTGAFEAVRWSGIDGWALDLALEPTAEGMQVRVTGVGREPSISSGASFRRVGDELVMTLRLANAGASVPARNVRLEQARLRVGDRVLSGYVASESSPITPEAPLRVGEIGGGERRTATVRFPARGVRRGAWAILRIDGRLGMGAAPSAMERAFGDSPGIRTRLP